MALNCFSIPYSRLIGRPSSVIFRLSELAHRVEDCAQKEEEEEEELPEVRPFIVSTYKFSWVISIHLLTESVERIWRKIKTFTLDDHLSNSHNISSSWCFYTVRRILMLIFFSTFSSWFLVIPPDSAIHFSNNCRLGTTSSPHFSSGIVERAKRKRAWKSPHARKAR